MWGCEVMDSVRIKRQHIFHAKKYPDRDAQEFGPDDDFFAKNIKSVVYDYIAQKITQDSDYYEESILNYSIEDNDYMSEFEKSQLEHEGSIRFYEPRIDIEGNLLPKTSNTVPDNIVMSSN